MQVAPAGTEVAQSDDGVQQVRTPINPNTNTESNTIIVKPDHELAIVETGCESAVRHGEGVQGAAK